MGASLLAFSFILIGFWLMNPPALNKSDLFDLEVLPQDVDVTILNAAPFSELRAIPSRPNSQRTSGELILTP